MTVSADSLAMGDEIELDVTNIAHGGVCVARHEGRVVFVADAIPGERVLARVTGVRKKSFVRASTLRVLEASPHRRAHVWPEAGIERDPDDRVGGAEFGHIELAHQRELKAFVLQDALKRMAGIDHEVTVHALPGDDERNGLGYRTRVRLHVDKEGRVGPYAARSNRVIPVENLPLAVDAVNQIAPLGELMPDVAAIDLVAPSGGPSDGHSDGLSDDEGFGFGDPRMLLTYAPEPGQQSGRGRATQRVGKQSEERIGENDIVLEHVDTREFQVRAGGFWQVHREAATTLFNAVRDAVSQSISHGDFESDAHNLDLYGGVGLLAAAMGDAVEAAGLGARFRVTSVESDERATDDAAENLAEWVGAMAITARVDRYLRELVREVHEAPTSNLGTRIRNATVILDPPRTGAGGNVVESLLALVPRTLIYVACDPVALARDIATLTGNGEDAGGYELTSLEGYDLFPHTHHVEAVAVLKRRESSALENRHLVE